MTKTLISATEAAKILDISPVVLWKKIKSGEIKAEKDGRSFLIEKSEILAHLNSTLKKSRKKDIKKAIRKSAWITKKK